MILCFFGHTSAFVPQPLVTQLIHERKYHCINNSVFEDLKVVVAGTGRLRTI